MRVLSLIIRCCLLSCVAVLTLFSSSTPSLFPLLFFSFFFSFSPKLLLAPIRSPSRKGSVSGKNGIMRSNWRRVRRPLSLRSAGPVAVHICVAGCVNELSEMTKKCYMDADRQRKEREKIATTHTYPPPAADVNDQSSSFTEDGEMNDISREEEEKEKGEDGIWYQYGSPIAFTQFQPS